MENRSIYHHYALLELEGETKNFSHAKKLLDDALSVKNSDEPDELIYTSLGKYFSLLGFQLEDEGKNNRALEAYDSAEKYFKKGRYENFRNVYSYHAQVVLNRKRAVRSKDKLEKVKLFSKGIDLCEDAIGNLSQVHHKKFREQEAIIAHLMGDLTEFDSIIESLAIDYGSALGYKLKANLLFRDSLLLSKDKQTQILEESYKIVDKGLKIENKEQGLLRLKASIGLKLFPTDIEEQYKVLKDWFDFSDQLDKNLLFQYGIILFKKDYYEDSLKVFKKLDYLSQGFPQRSLITNSYCIKENNEKKVYRGEITYIEPNANKGFIKCTSLPNLKYDIKYLYISFTPIVGDHVIFNICFNMRGIFAYQARKD
jgi:tetratricopeptide (TPR) repeat protein